MSGNSVLESDSKQLQQAPRNVSADRVFFRSKPRENGLKVTGALGRAAGHDGGYREAEIRAVLAVK